MGRPEFFRYAALHRLNTEGGLRLLNELLAIYFDGPENPYQIKLTGPAKTVEAYKTGFDEWVKNFK